MYMIFGFVGGLFNQIYYSDDNFLPIIMIGAGDLIYGICMYIVYGLLQNHMHILFYIRTIILPEMVYTVAVGLILHQILLRINDWLEKNNKGSADFV